MRTVSSLAIGPALVFVIAVAAGGCGHHEGPAGALDDYAHALKAHDYGHAYDLMSSGYRARVSREEYAKAMKDNAREADDTAERLRGKRGAVDVSADLTYGLGDQMRLTFEDGHWRIASNPIAFYDQSTPKAALRSFVRAYRLERWDLMLRFVPDQFREKMDAAKMKAQFTGPSKDQIEALVNTLESNLDGPVTERGNDARMSYGEHFEVKFTRENGQWKLLELN